MGHLISSLSHYLSKKWNNSKELVVVGFDAAGKTTIFEKLKLGEVIQSIPITGSGVHAKIIKCQNLEITSFDLGGDRINRLIWRFYYERSDAAIFVFDSLDKERSESAAEELHRLSSQMPEDKPILIFANKQDFQDAMKMEEINRVLRTGDLRQKTWYIQLCSGKTGEGLSDGFEWMRNCLWPNAEFAQRIKL